VDWPSTWQRDQSVEAFAEELRNPKRFLDVAVLMPPQAECHQRGAPVGDVWRALFQASFIGRLSLLKAAIARMDPIPASGRRVEIVMCRGISSAQVLALRHQQRDPPRLAGGGPRHSHSRSASAAST